MGVKSAHKFFRKKKIATETIDWPTFVSKNPKIYVDLMATCFQLIRTKMAHGKSAELIGILAPLFKHPNVVVVFDGLGLGLGFYGFVDTPLMPLFLSNSTSGALCAPK